MKIIKYIVLEMLLLITLLLCGTGVMKIFDVLLKIDYENIWSIGFKVGFTAWLEISIISWFIKLKKNKKEKR